MDILALVAAFGGGAFGALIGALPAFILTGVVAVAGAAVALAGGPDLLIGNVAFGSYLGPHIAFAGGVAAAAFAANMRTAKKIATTGDEIEYLSEGLQGADITKSLNLTEDFKVIAIGGIFGILGFLINYLYAGVLGFQTDTVAMTVATSGIIARLLLGKTGLTGKYTGNGKRQYFSTGKALTHNIVLSLSLGLGVSYIAASLTQTVGVPQELVTFFPTLCFGISAVSLVFAQTGSATPATHHITLIGALAAVSSGNPLVGVLFAVISCLLGDFVLHTFNSHCDSHIDPPACAIFVCTFIIMALF